MWTSLAHDLNFNEIRYSVVKRQQVGSRGSKSLSDLIDGLAILTGWAGAQTFPVMPNISRQ